MFSLIKDILAVDRSFENTFYTRDSSISFTNLILLKPEADNASNIFTPLNLSK
jgi:hypothetical protein